MDIIFIKEQFFIDNPKLVEMLDPGNTKKQSERDYLFLSVKYLGNNLLIPLRSNISSLKGNYKLGYPVPSLSRPNAGLDYRKMLIINDASYYEIPTSQRIAKSQMKTILNNYDKIEKAAIKYTEGYTKSVFKGREYKDFAYKFSTLHNYHDLLGINTALSEIAATK